MEKEKVGVSARIKMKGLKNKGLIEIAEDAKCGDYVLFMSKGVQRKGGMFNFPEEMWKVKCAKEEVAGVVEDFLNKDILGG